MAQTKARDEKKEEGSEAIQSIAVRQKLKELEAEIDKFRTENAALAEMRTEREEVKNGNLAFKTKTTLYLRGPFV